MQLTVPTRPQVVERLMLWGRAKDPSGGTEEGAAGEDAAENGCERFFSTVHELLWKPLGRLEPLLVPSDPPPGAL